MTIVFLTDTDTKSFPSSQLLTLARCLNTVTVTLILLSVIQGCLFVMRLFGLLTIMISKFSSSLTDPVLLCSYESIFSVVIFFFNWCPTRVEIISTTYLIFLGVTDETFFILLALCGFIPISTTLEAPVRPIFFLAVTLTTCHNSSTKNTWQL